MVLRRFLVCSLLLLSPSVWAAALQMVFVSPGFVHEAYWANATSVMRAAARDLGISLEILYAGKDQLNYVALVKEVTQRKRKPDYLIVTNEKLVGTRILPLIEQAQIKTLFAFSTLNEPQRVHLGGPREKFAYWLGSITSATEPLGEQSLDALDLAAKAARPEPGRLPRQVALIGGDKGTPSGLKRVQGALTALERHPDLALTQLVYGNWQAGTAREQTEVLLRRYPRLSMIWVANAEMAQGAIAAAEKLGRVPGKDLFFSAFDLTEEALKMRLSGKLSVLAGGQIMAGAAALILLYDAAHGKDFKTEGLEQHPAMTYLLDLQQARFLLTHVSKQDYSYIDYRSYSRVFRPQLKRHDFSTLLLKY